MIDRATEFEKRKRDMMELWENTFHDSKTYINLVFNTYFTLDNTFVRYDGETLISALLGVPYTFLAYDENGEKIQIRGFYLCGLATHTKWRKRGIMSHLMVEAEKTATERGYDMTFLIPASDNLREYYKRKGYFTASYRRHQIYNILFPLRKESRIKMNIYTIRDFLKQGKKTFIDRLAEWCCEIESVHNSYPTILHSKKDMLAIMQENENSFFLTDDTFEPEYPILTKVRTVIFPEFPESSNNKIRIVGWYSQERITLPKEITIKNSYSSDNIMEEEIANLSLKFFKPTIEFILPIVKGSEIGGVEPYAMIKEIKDNDFFRRNVNPEFNISLMLD